MCKLLFGLSIGVGLSIWCAVGVANADPYQWCAQYSGGSSGGGINCGFVTIAQCRATVSGIGGFCVPNQFYTGSDQTPPKHKRST